MSDALSNKQLPPSEQDLGWLGLTVFDLIGFNARSDTTEARGTLRRILPPARDGSYLRALVAAFRTPDGTVRAFSEAEEARWLVSNLRLEDLAQAREDSPLVRVWHDACSRANLPVDRARVNRVVLLRAIEEHLLRFEGRECAAFVLAQALEPLDE